MSVGRLGLRPWTLTKHEESVANELVVNYATGELALSDENKALISQAKLIREKCHINDFDEVCKDNNVFSTINKVVLDNKELPLVVSNGENILEGEELELPNFSQVMISVDIDAYGNINNKLVDINDRCLEIELTFSIDGVEKVIRGDFRYINNTLIEIGPCTLLKLTKITPIADDLNYDIYKIILYSIFLSGKGDN